MSAEEVELLEPIGRGGFSTVHRAQFRGSVIAVKKLQIEEDLNAEDAMKAFSTELSLMRYSSRHFYEFSMKKLNDLQHFEM